MLARDFDESLSAFRAGELVDRMTALINPGLYNQAAERNFDERLDILLDINAE